MSNGSGAKSSQSWGTTPAAVSNSDRMQPRAQANDPQVKRQQTYLWFHFHFTHE